MKKFIIPIFLLITTSGFAQIAVNSATFGMLEARQLGPGTMSGRISAIEGVAPENGKVIYVGTAGGGIWKTTNAGASFKPIFDKYCQSIGALAIHPTNPKIIYAGTGESNMRNSVSIGDGFYMSTDAGENWTKTGGLDSTEHISKIAIDPINPSTIFVAAPGPLFSDSRHRGLYKSTDGGKTFENIFFVNEKTGCADVCIDPKHPNIIYATFWEFRRLPYLFNSGGEGSGIFKSLDGGKTWKPLENGLPAKPFGRVALAIAPSAPNKLLAIVESSKTGLYITSDGGENWKQQSASMNVVSRPFYFSSLVIDPVDSNRIYRPAFTFSYSVDGGYSFAESSGDGGWLHSDHHALWINPQNNSHLILGTDGGVYQSLDKGVTWTFNLNLPVGQFYHVAVDNKTPYNLYGGLQDNGSWMAPSSAPGGVKTGDWHSVLGGDGFWVVPDGIDPNIIYAESQGGAISRIDIRNLKAAAIRPQTAITNEKLRWNWNTPIAIGTANPKNLYTAAQYLFKSTNQGRGWTKISPDLTTNNKRKLEQENSGGLSADNTSAENHCTIFTIAESPLDENLIWVGTDDGNLQYTVDGGKSWNNVAKNYNLAGIPAQTWVSSIEPSRFDKNVVFATFDNHYYGDHRTYIGRSNDLGKTWEVFKSEEFTGFAHKIKQDLKNKDLLFAGTEMGLFCSLDGGVKWFRMKNNIPWYSLVRDIQIHPETNDLIIATHGRGIMIVDDISPMRALTAEVLNKDVHLFELPATPLTMGQFGASGFSSTGGWLGENKPSIPAIQYYLKDRISSGNVTIEIYDSTGKLVQSLPGTKRKGINKVYWNQRMKGPKTAAGASKPDNGAFSAPQILPGNYTVQLKVVDKTYSQRLNLVHQENESFTLSDRVLQYNTAMELYAMHEQLANTVAEIMVKKKASEEKLVQTTDKKLRKTIEEYIEQLETLRATLIPTKSSSIFVTDEKLRENISEMYSSICNTEAAPGNLQLERVKTLKANVSDADTKSAAITQQFEEKVKRTIIKPKVSKQSNL
jgi:photosystem II stability/assembly factor-like uncharacterized protein